MRSLKKIVNYIFPYRYRRRIYKSFEKTFFCPICKNYSKPESFRFTGRDLPVFKEKQIIPPGKRKVVCPFCKSLDRERLIYAYLFFEEKIQKNKSAKILHIAPESNISQELSIRFKSNYIAGDLFMNGYSYPDHVQNIDVTGLPFEDNSFHYILCNHVLEHIEDDFKAMSEIYRVLKPSGKAILQVPISLNSKKTLEDSTITDPKDRERTYCQWDHVRLYGHDYKEKLESVGFILDRINISKKYRKFYLNKREDIFVVTK